MKTNLYKSALPRDSGVFLKIMVMITALLCSQLIVYGQPTQTVPVDGATNVAIPVQLQWTTSSTQGVDVEMYECTELIPNTPNTVDLSAYELICSATIGNNLEDLSGITYNEETNTLFIVRNSTGAETIYETTLSGELLRTITLSDEFYDTEGIVHLGGTIYAVTEERRGNIVIIDISTSPVSYTNSHVAELLNVLSSENNAGLEGVSYNPADNSIHTVKEGDLERNPRPWNEDRDYYSFIRHTSDVPSQTTTEPCDVLSSPFNNFIDLSGMHHLGLTDGLHHLGVAEHSMFLSHASRILLEIDENCNQISQLLLSAGGANGTLDNNINQPEGVTMDNNGNLYIVGEPNELYVFAKRTSNNPPLHHACGVNPNSSYDIPVQLLQPNTEYCWRIKNSDECVWSPFRSFTTPETICATTESFSTESRISNNIDDVEEREIGGTVSSTSTDLELVYDSGATGNQYVGLLFRNLNIPPEALITNAYIQFAVDEQNTETTFLNIAAHDADNAALFSTANYNVSNRILTCASVDWEPDEWNSVGDAGADQKTPDISYVVQEVVSRSGWSVNSNLAIIITGTGERTAESYDGDASDAPIIYVNYTTGTIVGDSDNDGVCDDEDTCPNQNDDLIGMPCDDGNVCTTGETYDMNCNCTGGTLVDSDNDGVCDVNDNCPGEDDDIIGTNCDDSDPCTTGDVYDSSCNCSGTFQDMDGDGVCDANDICLGDDNVDTDGDGVPDDCDNCDNDLEGTTCEDGDLCTTGETYDVNCNCTGGTVEDTDNDGICDEEDTCPDDPTNSCDIPYCEAQGNTEVIAYIESIQLNGGVNTSGDNGGYFDYTGTILARLSTNNNTIILKPKDKGNISTLTQNWGIWIDFNKDGDFDDVDEQVYVGTSPDSVTEVEGTFDALPGTGTTTMRVVMTRAPVTPCGSFSNGEVEDYKILLSTDCEENLTIYNFDVSGSYDASNFTKTDDTSGASVIVNTNEHLELSGGNRVRLNNGFSVTSGASLRADNEDCSQ